MASHSSLKTEPVSDSVVTDILTRIAEAENVGPTELTPPLHDVLDPEALERLLRGGKESTYAIFKYRQWVVKVWSNGDISLTPFSGGE